MYQSYVRNYINTSRWQHPDPNRCGCRGGGWWVSDLDSAHRCRLHWAGQPDPYDEIRLPFPNAYTRKAYADAREHAAQTGEMTRREFNADFKARVARNESRGMSHEWATRWALHALLVKHFTRTGEISPFGDLPEGALTPDDE